jgi:tetratricopeptide (TPR) repeat protein
MRVLASFLGLMLVVEAPAQDLSPLERAQIRILVGKASTVSDGNVTVFDAGPVVGQMLNAHYFPALRDYGSGRYDYAERDMTFVINHPAALDENPRKGEFYSTAHYIRGMIYFYHASGVGRHRLAKADFEAAIEWNPANFVAYLELSRVYSELGLKDPAASIIHRLLDLNPDKAIAEQARVELRNLGIEAKP